MVTGRVLGRGGLSRKQETQTTMLAFVPVTGRTRTGSCAPGPPSTPALPWKDRVTPWTEGPLETEGFTWCCLASLLSKREVEDEVSLSYRWKHSECECGPQLSPGWETARATQPQSLVVRTLKAPPAPAQGAELSTSRKGRLAIRGDSLPGENRLV